MVQGKKKKKTKTTFESSRRPQNSIPSGSFLLCPKIPITKFLQFPSSSFFVPIFQSRTQWTDGTYLPPHSAIQNGRAVTPTGGCVASRTSALVPLLLLHHDLSAPRGAPPPLHDAGAGVSASAKHYKQAQKMSPRPEQLSFSSSAGASLATALASPLQAREMQRGAEPIPDRWKRWGLPQHASGSVYPPRINCRLRFLYPQTLQQSLG